MAKANTTNPFADLMAGLSEEEQAILGKLTGQANSGGGSKTPVIKINFNRVDANGKKVNKGNFVLGQKSGLVDGKPGVLEIGTDLGDSLEAIILKYGNQFSYYSNDAKKRCSSQIICDRGEVPVGNNLKNVCNDRSCPRRKDGIDKAEKCANQFIVYVRLPEGTKLPDGTDATVAMMYLKGAAYIPFKDYVEKDLKGIPSIAVKTKFTTTEEGTAVSYWQVHFSKGEAVSKEVFKENFQLVSGISTQLVEYKEDMAKKMLEGPKESYKAKEATIVNDDDDQIAW